MTAKDRAAARWIGEEDWNPSKVRVSLNTHFTIPSKWLETGCTVGNDLDGQSPFLGCESFNLLSVGWWLTLLPDMPEVSIHGWSYYVPLRARLGLTEWSLETGNLMSPCRFDCR